MGSKLPRGPTDLISPDFHCHTITIGIGCNLCVTRRALAKAWCGWCCCVAGRTAHLTRSRSSSSSGIVTQRAWSILLQHEVMTIRSVPPIFSDGSSHRIDGNDKAQSSDTCKTKLPSVHIDLFLLSFD